MKKVEGHFISQKEMDAHRKNMPETIENMFSVLFKDESWSWTGLATILVRRYGKPDLEELDYAIKAELEKENK